MLRRALFVHTLFVGFLLVIPALAGAVVRRSAERPTETDYHPEWEQAFPGGPNTLPYGMGQPDVVRDHAYVMGCVQQGITTMLSFGYTRTQQYDAAFTQTGYSVVIIAFERPGQPDHVIEQPSLFVITKPFQIPGVGWRPATQVFAGTVFDSAGFLRTQDDPNAFFVQGTYTGSDVRVQECLSRLQTMGMLDEPGSPPWDGTGFDAVVIEPLDRAWTWWMEQSPRVRNLAYNCARQVSAGAISGAMLAANRPGATWGQIGAGAAIGGVVAYANYWAHPDTTGP